MNCGSVRSSCTSLHVGFAGIRYGCRSYQILARAVIDLGGSLEVIVPASEYRDGLPADAQPEHDSLLATATNVRRLPYTESSSESHMAASTLMIDTADEVYAVWDGQPARGCGGTADVVAYAASAASPSTSSPRPVIGLDL